MSGNSLISDTGPCLPESTDAGAALKLAEQTSPNILAALGISATAAIKQNVEAKQEKLTTSAPLLFGLTAENLTDILLLLATQCIEDILNKNPIITCLDSLLASDPLKKKCFKLFINISTNNFKWDDLEKERIQETWQQANEAEQSQPEQTQPDLTISDTELKVFTKLLEIFTIIILYQEEFELGREQYEQLCTWTKKNLLPKNEWDNLINAIIEPFYQDLKTRKAWNNLNHAISKLLNEKMPDEHAPDNSDAKPVEEEKNTPVQQAQLPEPAQQQRSLLALENRSLFFSREIQKSAFITRSGNAPAFQLELFKLAAHAIIETNPNNIKSFLTECAINAQTQLGSFMTLLKIETVLNLCQQTKLQPTPQQYKELIQSQLTLTVNTRAYTERWPTETQDCSLHTAAAHGNAALVQQHITNKKDIHASVVTLLDPQGTEIKLHDQIKQQLPQQILTANQAEQSAHLSKQLVTAIETENKSTPKIINLLQHRADPNTTDKFGNTMLQKAITVRAPLPTVKALLDANAEINAADKHGSAPLHLAMVFNAPLEVVQTLLDAKADPNQRNKLGNPPLLMAVHKKENAVEYIQALHAAKADLNAKNSQNYSSLHAQLPDCTALHFVLRNGDKTAAAYLVVKGAEQDALAQGIAKENGINLATLPTFYKSYLEKQKAKTAQAQTTENNQGKTFKK